MRFARIFTTARRWWAKRWVSRAVFDEWIKDYEMLRRENEVLSKALNDRH